MGPASWTCHLYRSESETREMSMPSRGLCWRSAYSYGEYKLDRNQILEESSLTLAIRFWLILSVLDDAEREV